MESISSPLFHEGWLEFNHLKWNVRPGNQRLTLDDAKDSHVDFVYYLNKKGKLCMPRLNPFLPVNFTPSPTTKTARLNRQWLTISAEMVRFFNKHQLSGSINLSPNIQDLRAWAWQNYMITPRYTLSIPFPFSLESTQQSVRKQINKSIRNNNIVKHTTNLKDVYECLIETEKRQSFSHHLSLADLELAQSLMGEDHFRAYVCYTPENRPVSARVILHYPGCDALDWIAGTKNDSLTSGVTQHLIYEALRDLEAHEATGFDFGGANILNIATAKHEWNAKLVTFFSLKQLNLTTIAKQALQYLKLKTKRRDFK